MNFYIFAIFILVPQFSVASVLVRRDVVVVGQNFSSAAIDFSTTKRPIHKTADLKTSLTDLFSNIQKLIEGLIKLLEKLANEKKKAGEAIFGAAVNATQSGLLENALFMKLALLQSIAQRGPELGGAVVNVVQGAATTSTDAVKFFICTMLCPKTNSSTDEATNEACRQLNECDGGGPSTQASTTAATTTTATATATAKPKLSNDTFNPFGDDYGDYVQEK